MGRIVEPESTIHGMLPNYWLVKMRWKGMFPRAFRSHAKLERQERPK
jgi:hypothetical protein